MDLKDPDTWRKQLGLLPVPLFRDSEDEVQFILLNGVKGNFCLDLRESQPDYFSERSIAWSANVGCYITLSDGHLVVQRWNRQPGQTESYNCQDVINKLQEFHRYLEDTHPDSSFSVVTHGARAFRSLRTALGKRASGTDALKAFLLLLAAASEGSAPDSVDLVKWNLDQEALDIASMVPPQDWAILVAELIRGRSVDDLNLKVDLLLRHASGLMFQEAHYEALLPDHLQLSLGLFPPDPARLTRQSTGVGLHFTPPALARTLVEECLATLPLRKFSKLKIFDPACGSGEFLREALRQLRLNGFPGQIELEGWDISDAACAMARFALAWDIGKGSPAKFKVENRNSLSADSVWPGADLLLMNPPFLSWQDMSADQRDIVSATLGSNLRKRPDLSAAFMVKAGQAISGTGVLGSIIPASFLNADSAGPVREALSKHLKPRMIARLGSHILFPGAMVETAFYVATADACHSEPPLAFWADYRVRSASAGLRELRRARYYSSRLDFPIAKEGYSIYHNEDLGKGEDDWSPRPYHPWQLLLSLSHHPRVKDLFIVHQGARTGHNKVFVLSKEDWRALPKRERGYFRPAVLNESLRDGVLQDVAYVFFPYGKKYLGAENALRQELPTYYGDHLKGYQGELKVRQRADVEEWWLLSRHRSWQTEPTPKIVSTYFGSGGSFAWDDNGQFVVVQGHAWLPRENAFSLEFSRKLALPYLVILNSSIFSELLAATSNHVGGGQWNLSARFVEDIPLPRLDSPNLSESLLEDLLSEGELILAKGIEPNDAQRQERIRELAASAYGILS
jgi:hypothetical protein